MTLPVTKGQHLLNTDSLGTSKIQRKIIFKLEDFSLTLKLGCYFDQIKDTLYMRIMIVTYSRNSIFSKEIYKWDHLLLLF